MVKFFKLNGSDLLNISISIIFFSVFSPWFVSAKKKCPVACGVPAVGQLACGYLIWQASCVAGLSKN
jgi:hypothetical protein